VQDYRSVIETHLMPAFGDMRHPQSASGDIDVFTS